MPCTTSDLVGAAVGAVAGAAVLTAVFTTSPSSQYTAPAVRSVATSAPVNVRGVAYPRTAEASLVSQRAVNQEAVIVQQAATQSSAPAFVLLASAAAAVSGLLFWNSRRVSMAATTGRREALMAGVAAASMAAGPAFAAYGDSANVFGKPKDVEQYFEIKGDGWSGKMPGKYNVSKEREIDGIVGRWEDNFDAVNNSFVLVQNVGKNSVTELGDIDTVRNNIVTPLLGQQAFDGQSISEGGFAPGRYSAAAILDQKEVSKGGKTYYYYELLTRTADGNEGGRHQLFSVTASNGKLYVYKAQAGDKRWFKGLEKPLRATVDAFTVA